jgi:hypothetical protein
MALASISFNYQWISHWGRVATILQQVFKQAAKHLPRVLCAVPIR